MSKKLGFALIAICAMSAGLTACSSSDGSGSPYATINGGPNPGAVNPLVSQCSTPPRGREDGCPQDTVLSCIPNVGLTCLNVSPEWLRGYKIVTYSWIEYGTYMPYEGYMDFESIAGGRVRDGMAQVCEPGYPSCGHGECRPVAPDSGQGICVHRDEDQWGHRGHR